MSDDAYARRAGKHVAQELDQYVAHWSLCAWAVSSTDAEGATCNVEAQWPHRHCPWVCRRVDVSRCLTPAKPDQARSTKDVIADTSAPRSLAIRRVEIRSRRESDRNFFEVSIASTVVVELYSNCFWWQGHCTRAPWVTAALGQT